MLYNSKAMPASIKQIRSLLEKRLGSLEVELFKQLNTKADKEEIEKLVKSNPTGQIERVINEKVDRREIEDLLIRVE